MEMTSRESGLVVPVEREAQESKALWSPLELRDEEQRKVAQLAFQELFLLTSSGGIRLPDDEVNPSRRRLLMALAVEFLGPDVEFWEYT
jgi:hypothetical protein